MKVTPIIPCPFKPLRGFYACLFEAEKSSIAIPEAAQTVHLNLIIAAVGPPMFDQDGKEATPQCKVGQYVYPTRAPSIVKTKDGRQWAFIHESEIRAVEDE